MEKVKQFAYFGFLLFVVVFIKIYSFIQELDDPIISLELYR